MYLYWGYSRRVRQNDKLMVIVGLINYVKQYTFVVRIFCQLGTPLEQH